MCGIVGLLTFGDDTGQEEKMRRKVLAYLLTEAMEETQSRGKDATGIAVLHRSGNYMGLKMGVEASLFMSRYGKKNTDYSGFLKVMCEAESPVQAILGHCRKTSVGGSTNNNNNHPIKVRETVGIHNGTLKNHDKIFKNLGCRRDGEVDSEAIFRLLDFYSEGGKLPYTKEMLLDVTTKLDGSFACLAFNGNNPFQVVAFRDDRPIEMILLKPLNTVFVGSELNFLKVALYRLNKSIHLYNMFPEKYHMSEKVIESKVLVNRAGAIFDLTRKVDEKTNITDLYTYVDIPYKKIWDVTNTKIYTKKSTPFVGKKTDKDRKLGYVWQQHLRGYSASSAEVECDKTKNAIEIDIDTGNTSEIFTTQDSENVCALTPTDDVEAQLLNSKANIKEIEALVKTENDILDDATEPEMTVETKPDDEVIDVEATIVKNDEKDNNNNNSIVDISDIEINAEAFEAAANFIKTVDRFTDSDDLAEKIELENAEVLTHLSPHALGNRIMSFVGKCAFYKGWVSAKKLKNDMEKETSNVTDNIRNLKKVTINLAKMLDKVEMTETTHNNLIETGTRLLLLDKDMVGAIGNIFSQGDMRNSPTLKKLITFSRRIG